MNEDYSDDETLELQEEDQSAANQRWPANNSSDRIRRSCASTDIAALQQMDAEMDEDSGREEMEEHVEALPQKWIEYYKVRFNSIQMNQRWSPPDILEDKFRELASKAVIMCDSGHADGTFEVFVEQNLVPLFRKWYLSGDAFEHWGGDIFVSNRRKMDQAETVFKVIRMMRGLLITGAGSRDIPPVFWELFYYATGDLRPNHFVGEKVHLLRLELDESAERELIKADLWPQDSWIHKHIRYCIMVFDKEGFQALARFYKENITASTSIEDFVRYLKGFRVMVLMLNHDKAYSTFGEMVYTAIDRVTGATEEEMSCKNLRGQIEGHPLYALYQFLLPYVLHIRQLQAGNDNLITLTKFRIRFCLRALNEAPFNGRMSAVEHMTILFNDFPNVLAFRENVATLQKTIEDERTVDMLTKDNLHNMSYVDRIRCTFEAMLRASLFSTADLSTVWEAQRGKHDVIQRNLADLIVRVAPHFNNELLEGLFHKILAGWVDGGTREREMLIDIVRKIGENSASNILNQRAYETDQAQLASALDTLWKFIRTKAPGAEQNEVSALQSHLKLLEDAHTPGYMKNFAALCARDIRAGNEMAATAAHHMVAILELYDDGEEDDDDYEPNAGRCILIAELERNHSLVHSLCGNIAATVNMTDNLEIRRNNLSNFILALSYSLTQCRDIKLSETLASELWRALVTNPVYEQDKKHGFKFFVTVVEQGAFENPLLEIFFKQYVLAQEANKMTAEGYTCFEAFFKCVNDLQTNDFAHNPENLVGSAYVRNLILLGQTAVNERASNLWVDFLQKMIDKAHSAERTAVFVKTLVDLIRDEYNAMGVTVAQAVAIGMSPFHNPRYELAKEKTTRCIKLLSLLVTNMDDEVGVARRSEPSLGRAAIGRPIYVSCKVPRREWESISYRGSIRYDELDVSADMHENSTVAELRELLKRFVGDKLARRGRQDYEDFLSEFLLVHLTDEGPKTLHFSDYKRTLGEMGMGDTVEVEIRLNRGGMRNGEESPDTSTSESDWMSPEEMDDDVVREAVLPSRALADDEDMVDLLLHVAESGDVDIAMDAFKILTSIPPNGEKLSHLRRCVEEEELLTALFEDASAPQFLYHLMMLEAIILPQDAHVQPNEIMFALKSMMMFVRVLPNCAELSKMMNNRSIAFRSLAILPITHILNLACSTAGRIVAGHWQIRYGQSSSVASMILSVVRLSKVDIRGNWPKHIRVRKISQAFSEFAPSAIGGELLELVQTNARLIFHIFCSVILSASSFTSWPLSEEGAAALISLTQSREPLLDEAVLTSDPFSCCTVPALIECAVFGVALLATACPRQCAESIGAVRAQPDPVWIQTLVAAIFHKTENVRLLTWQLTTETVEAVRSSLISDNTIARNRESVSLTTVVLDLLPSCRGRDKFADQFISLVRECVNRSKDWNAEIAKMEAHIDQGVEFLEQALLHSTAQQTPYQDETYLRARIEVLCNLIKRSSDEKRIYLGSGEGGPRLCERLLADFIFPAARTPEAAAAVADAVDSIVREEDALPRSVTQMEMNSSSSLFELRGDASPLPRSLSALPISTRRVAVCSGEGSQQGVFELLLCLCDSLPVNQMLLQHTIQRLFYSNQWAKASCFEYMPHYVLRGEGSMVGLRNGGATCYMNSIFQQLFMIDEVREAVLNATIPEKVLLERRASDSDSSSQIDVVSLPAPSPAAAPNRGDYAVKVLAAVQTLFAHLLASDLDAFKPTEFWKVFNFKPNGESVNVREQQDAVEFHNMVTELIDEGLKQCGSEPVCERIFKGMFADEKICKDCPHRYTKNEPFESLNLDVRSHNNLRDSLKEYVKGDVLENDNAYACELCNKKVKAIKRMSLAKLPEVLIVQLKRFDFDWEKDTPVKFNDCFEFPFEIDMQPYTLEGLEKLEKNIPLENNSDYQYALRGVVVHSGQAQGGHYTSYIRNRETGKWFKFDDSDVSPWEANTASAAQRWFGCLNDGLDSLGRGRRKIRTTYWNAYMLFYEKIETANRCLSVFPSSIASDMSTSSGVSSMATPMPPLLMSSSAVSPSPLSISPTSGASSSTATASSSGTATATTSAAAASPVHKQDTRSGAAGSPVSHLHRHFSSMSLSSHRIRMPPRLEEMLREGNRRVQLERVQYSAHFFSFITAATGKATTAAELNSSCGETLALATMKSFASFIVHNGLFANRELLNEHGTMGKCSYTTWLDWLQRLLAFRSARLWLITHVLFNHEMAATFLFSTDSGVREFFQKVIVKTMCVVDEEGDASEKCLDAAVSSVTAHTLANTMRVFPRLSYLLANLLGLLPFKHNAAFRTEPVNFYRALIDLADRKNMMLAIVRGGILNNLLSLFNALGSDLSTLHRRDTHVYEDLHRVIADAFRTIRPKVDPHPNPYYNDIVVVRTDEVPDLRMFQEFMQPTGGHVKCIHNLIDILRRATRNNGHSLGWVSHGILYLCWNNNKASNAVMDMVCQSSGNMVTETATDLLMGLLSNLFFMRDGLAAARFEHIFYKVQLTSTHAHPSVQGLIEFQNVSQNRYEVFIRVALHLVECLPDVFNMLNADPRAKELLGTLNTLAMLKSATNAWCKQYHETYEDVRTAGSGGATSDSETDFDTTNDDSLMDEEEEEKSSERGGEGEEEGRAGGGGGVRPSQHDHIIVSDGVGHQYKHRVIRRVKQSSSSASPGQLSPSSGMGAMTISSPASIVGEKRPLPPTEEGEETDGSTDGRSDRKRSIVSAVSPMDDSDLLISSSTASTSRGMPACPPPAYELIGGGGGASTGRRSPVARVTPLVPPPLPPRPIAKARPKSPLVTDEFVQKHKEE